MDPFGMIGSIYASERSASSARDATRANERMSDKQMAFQERMSNTAHQREISDLKLAGLNPLLSVTGGAGASSPSGSMGSAQSSTFDNPLSGWQAAAQDVKRLKLEKEKQAVELGNMKKDGDLKESQKKATDAQTIKTATENAVLRRGIPEAELKEGVYNHIKKVFKDRFKSNSTGDFDLKLK